VFKEFEKNDGVVSFVIKVRNCNMLKLFTRQYSEILTRGEKYYIILFCR